jgi:hypothetical protein
MRRVGPADWKMTMGILVQQHARDDLLEVILALRSPGGLASRLDGGQQQGNEDANDRNDHQQLD